MSFWVKYFCYVKWMTERTKEDLPEVISELGDLQLPLLLLLCVLLLCLHLLWVGIGTVVLSWNGVAGLLEPGSGWELSATVAQGREWSQHRTMTQWWRRKTQKECAQLRQCCVWVAPTVWGWKLGPQAYDYSHTVKQSHDWTQWMTANGKKEINGSCCERKRKNYNSSRTCWFWAKLPVS